MQVSNTWMILGMSYEVYCSQNFSFTLIYDCIAGHSMFGYGHHLTNAYSALLTGGRAGQYASTPMPPTTSSYGSLGTLSVAASQAASLGINNASEYNLPCYSHYNRILLIQPKIRIDCAGLVEICSK